MYPLFFPVLRGLVAPHLAPVTYFFTAVNIFVFIFTLQSFELHDRKIDEIISDSNFSQTQGSAFATMIEQEPQKFSPMLRALGSRARAGDSDSKRSLGGLALRNNEFMSRAETYEFGGDEVALEEWRHGFQALRKHQAEHPTYQWGVSRANNDWSHWITYQFSHSGLMHLAWNLLFLVLFGCFIETALGSSFVVFAYLGGGICGAWLFSLLSGISAAPLVGASGSVSGLMGLVAFAWFRKEGVNFFYWILPFRGYFGFAALPSWLVFVIFILPDISSHLESSRDFGSVAYSAHLGGAAFGALIAGLLALGILKKEIEDRIEGGQGPGEKTDLDRDEPRKAA